MVGLLDWFQTPQGIGLLSGVASYAANARRGAPVNSIGRGLAGGLAGYGLAQDQIRQAEQDKVQNELRALQMEQARAQLQSAKGQQAWKAGLPSVMEQAKTKVTPYEADNPFGEDLGLLANVQQGNPQALQEYLMRPDSPFADKLIEQQLFPKEQEWDTTPRYDQQGRAFVTSKTGQIKYLDGIAERVDPNKPFMLGPDGRIVPNAPYQEYEYTKAKKGASNISLDARNYTTQETEQSKAYGKNLGEMRGAMQQAGFDAPRKLANLARMEQLLTGIDGGSLAKPAMAASSFASSVGIKIDPRLGDKEAAESLAIEMALAMREPGSGPMTDKDFNNYLNTVPSVAKTAEGRKEITKTLKAKANRDVVIAKMAREYARRNNGVIDDNFLDQVAQYVADNPVVPVNTNQKNEVLKRADEIVKGQR